MLKKVLLRGVFFIIPLGILIFVFLQIYKVAIGVADIVDGIIPIETVAGIGIANLLALLIIILLCIIAGLLSYVSVINERVSTLDTILANNVPGYLLVKGALGAGSDDPYVQDSLKPVMINMENFHRIGFETDRGNGFVVVYFPNEPSVITGHSVVVAEERVRILEIPPRQVLGLLQVHGAGLASFLAAEIGFDT